MNPIDSTTRGITLYLHVHQPWRVRQYSIFDVASRHDYFSGGGHSAQDNEQIFHGIAEKSYLEMNRVLERTLANHPEFKLSLSISGVFLEQAQQFNPEVIRSFQRLVATGRVELLASPYYHSLAFFYSRREFESQIALQKQKIQDIFGVTPRVLANTELAYNNDLAKWAEAAGFRGVLAEGWDTVLGWRSPNFAYRPPETQNIGLLLKNYRLSDDIAFRFSNQDWSEWPLTADKYHSWLAHETEQAPLVNLFMDYETFGEHQWKDTGIFSFFEHFVAKWLSTPGHTFYTVSGALDAHAPVGEISMPRTVTWADSERDLTAWNGNDLQTEALRYLYELEEDVLRSGDIELIGDWRRLQTSDHLYYMCTKWFTDGDVHAYFSPYESPYDAFLYYMNAIRDIRWRLSAHRYGGF